MWQRLQTLYLAVSCALIGSMFFCRMATVIGPEGDEVYIGFSEKLGYLLLMISLLTGNLICLFTFKVRILQMRVAIIVALMLLGFQIWLAVDWFQVRGQMVYSVAAVFPLVCAILNVLAARSIFMDESMVQQASRIRSYKKKKRKERK